MPIDPRTLADAALGVLPRFTVAIFGSGDRHLDISSGVLFQAGESHFILSAAHVLEDHAEEAYLLGGFDGETLSLLASAVVTEREPLDIAVIPLATETARDLQAKGKAFVRRVQVDVNDPTWTRRGLYAACGFPAADVRAESRREASINAYIHVADPAPLDPSPTRMFDPRQHIALVYEEGEAQLSSPDSYVIRSPKGMSGGGIWRLGYPREDDGARWSDDQIRLVGIQHTYGPAQSAISGTRIGPVLQVLREQFPELGGALDLVVATGS